MCVYTQGELKGEKGLVPSNFLEEFKEEEETTGERERRKSKRKSTGGLGMEIFAANEQDMEQAKRIIAEVSSALLLALRWSLSRQLLVLWPHGKSRV